MSNAIAISITFHSPFHVATGEATRGLDSSVDHSDLLPASSLKGVMRRAAADVLDEHHPLVREVFGTPGVSSPWSWGRGEFADQPRIDERSRIAVGLHGVVENGALLRQEIVEADAATFRIIRREPIAADRIADHIRLLDVSARLVRSLGADRNRGYGWVSMTTDQAAGTAEDLAIWIRKQREAR